MPVKPNFNPNHLYFVTTNAVKRLRIFNLDAAKKILLDSLQYLRTQGQMKLFAFVVMPNHIHLIAQFSNKYPLSAVMRDFKKYTARQIYHHFQVEGNPGTLDLLKKEGRLVNQDYKVWEDGYDARDVYTEKFLSQKLDYIHNNPCQPQWKLVESPELYPWPTAGCYLTNKPCIISIDDIREFLLLPAGHRPALSEEW